jgi:Mg-chelatase subunit ChlD
MRTRLVVGLALVLLAVAVVPAFPQGSASAPFKIEFDPKNDIQPEQKGGLQVTVKFSVVRVAGKGDEPAKNYKVVIKEDGREVKRVDVPEPKVVDRLSAVLAVDISGSKDRTTGENNAKRRIDQSKEAATEFLKGLPAEAECGMILFDHQILKGDIEAPTLKREPLKDLIKNMKPRGGTAYLDATKEAITLLAKKSADHKKVAVLMTDGVDVRSKATLAEVIKYAKDKKVSLYTIGIGQPGKLEPVTSVLVLDRSASMEEPADEKDPRSKIVALRAAASKFVNMLPKMASTTVLPFGSSLGTARDFPKPKDDKDALLHKDALLKDIQAITTEGETKMLDAAYEAISMLAAARRPGKNAVVVMTDGIDNVSRLRPEDVIAKAKEAGVTVHMLLFGKEEELQQAKGYMEKIAKETGGTFNHVKNEQALIKVFEEMSIVLHDDGIDEVSLKKLASETGGLYYPARKITELKFITAQISQDVQREHHTVTFASERGYDGTGRRITIELVKLVVVERPGGVNTVQDVVVDTVAGDVVVRGVVVAEMHPIVYLGLFMVLVAMAAVPPAVGRMFRSSV